MIDQACSLRNMMEREKDLGIKFITITSGKGGVGKSSFALNFAIALNRLGKRVLIIDMDLGLANIDVMLGINTKYDLLSVINEQKDIREVIEEGLQGVQFVSGGSGIYEMLKMNTEQIGYIIENLYRLGDMVDMVIFDTGAGISDNILKLICASHETILVATPEPTSIMDAYALVKILSNRQLKPSIRLVINKAENEREALAAMSGFVQIAEKYMDTDIEGLGYILDDVNMVKAVKKQVPLLICNPKSSAAINIERLANKYLMRPEVPKYGLLGFFERLSNRRIHIGE